jgi:CheY-like chemotaxis protein
VKFTPNNKNIFVTIGYDDGFLNISVKDEGKGIAQEKLEHIFEAFSQEHSLIASKYGGTGLGLSISYELVKLLGGSLNVKSEVDVGSEFYFSIPIKKADCDVIEIKDSIKDSFSEHILLVEDNKANQVFMKVLFKKLNLTYDISNDGLEAIEMYKKASYDLILMDENMPYMNGIEAAKNIVIYEKENGLKHTPIVALTANALKGDREKFLEAGMDEYLTKPLDKKRLIEVLSKLLNKI